MLTLIAGTAAVTAVDEPTQVGFQAGMGWILPQEQQFQGTTMSLYLYLAPQAEIDVGYLHEEIYLMSRVGGGESDESPSSRGHFDAVRARYRIFDDEIQSMRVLASAGYSQFDGGRITEGFAFDLGVDYSPLKLSSAAVSSELAIQLRYRYCRFGPAPVTTDARPLHNASGFIIGLAGDVRF